MNIGQAEVIALQALSWIVSDPDQSGPFMAQSGLSPDHLRENAADSEFLGSVLDFLLSNEPSLLAFCHDMNLPNESVARARQELPGGQVPNWT